jgi:hypothetical protein
MLLLLRVVGKHAVQQLAWQALSTSNRPLARSSRIQLSSLYDAPDVSLEEFVWAWADLATHPSAGRN